MSDNGNKSYTSFYTIGKSDITNLYSQIRLRNQRELDARREQIFREIPELKSIDRELSETNSGFMKRIIFLSGEAAEAAKQERKEMSGKLIRERDRLLQEHGYSADALTLSYDCPVCRDTGIAGEGRCECYKRHLSALLYRQSSLGAILEKENFSTFSLDYYSKKKENESLPSPYDNMVQILDRAKSFTENYDSDHKSFLFYGESGLGKTFLSHCIAKELMDRGISVLYVTANELFQQILSPYIMSSGDSEERQGLRTVFDLVFNAELLVLDDLGTELTNSFTHNQLFEIVNRRILDDRSTIISTNLSLKQMKQRYDDRILSRLIERYELCRLYGQNIRTIKKSAELK